MTDLDYAPSLLASALARAGVRAHVEPSPRGDGYNVSSDHFTGYVSNDALSVPDAYEHVVALVALALTRAGVELTPQVGDLPS